MYMDNFEVLKDALVMGKGVTWISVVDSVVDGENQLVDFIPQKGGRT